MANTGSKYLRLVVGAGGQHNKSIDDRLVKPVVVVCRLYSRCVVSFLIILSATNSRDHASTNRTCSYIPQTMSPLLLEWQPKHSFISTSLPLLSVQCMRLFTLAKFAELPVKTKQLRSTYEWQHRWETAITIKKVSLLNDAQIQLRYKILTKS